MYSSFRQQLEQLPRKILASRAQRFLEQLPICSHIPLHKPAADDIQNDSKIITEIHDSMAVFEQTNSS